MISANHLRATLLSLLGVAGLQGCGGAELSQVAAGQSVAVQVAPAQAELAPGESLQYATAVTGTTDTGVTWSVLEGTACGSVSQGGLYQAPAAGTTCHVVVTSTADAAQSATATVTVTAAACTPAVCRAGIDCGTIPDGCGGTLGCGNACTGAATCGGGGIPNVCGGGASGTFLNGFFPIAAYGQNAGEFAAWKAIGANTVQGVPNEYVAEWAAGARALGLKQIRQPIGSTGGTPPSIGSYPAASDPDFGTGNVLAWEGVMTNGSGWDEIEFSFYGSAKADVQSYAQAVGRALHAADPATPVFLNVGINGLGLADGWPYSGGAYSMQGLFSTLDFVCNDIYPYGGSSYNDSELHGSMGGDHVVTASDVATYPLLAPMLGKGSISSIGVILDKLHAALPAKALAAFVELGQVTTASPTVPPGGVRAEMWNAIIHGARGVFVFAYAGQLSAAGEHAQVPSANAAELARQAAVIGSLSSAIQDTVNPATLSASSSNPALDIGWRDTPSGKYFFVLNTTNVDQGTATVSLTGTGGASSATVHGESRSVTISGGHVTDSFGPYALHIYLVP
jgi:hypothetical protein